MKRIWEIDYYSQVVHTFQLTIMTGFTVYTFLFQIVPFQSYVQNMMPGPVSPDHLLNVCVPEVQIYYTKVSREVIVEVIACLPLA